MLKRRYKRRYLCIVHAVESPDLLNVVSELFGSIAAEKASIRHVQHRANESIISCRLEQLENVLVAITLIDPPVLTIDMSGSIRQLRRRRRYSNGQATQLH